MVTRLADVVGLSVVQQEGQQRRVARSFPARAASLNPARSSRVLGEELCREGDPIGARFSLRSLTAVSCSAQARGKNWLISKSVTWAS